MFASKEYYHHLEVQVSDILESHGIPDVYKWRKSNFGKLIPENSNTPIENIIIKNNYIGGLEYSAFQKIQKNTRVLDDNGYILWFSPKHPIYYPDRSKIIITQKDNNMYINRAIATNWSAVDSVLIARNFASISTNLNEDQLWSDKDVRLNPIFINASHKNELLTTLQKVLDKKSLHMMSSGEDILAKARYMADIAAGRIVASGQNPRTCPVEMTAFGLFAGEDQYGSLQFDCPHCHQINAREFGKLLEKCQHCEQDVRC